MKAFIVYGDHWDVPSRRTSVHLSKDSADRGAIELVNLLLTDFLEDKPDFGLPTQLQPGDDWQATLTALQMGRIVDDLDTEQLQALEKGEAPYGYASYEAALDEISQCAVWIEEHEIVGGMKALSLAWSQGLADQFSTAFREAMSLPCTEFVKRSGYAPVDYAKAQGFTEAGMPAAAALTWNVHALVVHFEHDAQMHQRSLSLLANNISVADVAQRGGRIIEKRYPGHKVKGVRNHGPVLEQFRRTYRLKALRDGEMIDIEFVGGGEGEAREACFWHLCDVFRVEVDMITGDAVEISDWDDLCAECDFLTLEEVA